MAFKNIGIVYNAIKKYGAKSVFIKGFLGLSLLIFALVIGGVILFVTLFSGIYDNKRADGLSLELYSTRNRIDGITRQINSSCAELQERYDLASLAANDKEKLQELLYSEKKDLGFLNSVYLYIPDENYIISTSNIYKSDNMTSFPDKSWIRLYKNGESFFYREFPDIGIVTKCFSYVKNVKLDKEYVFIYNVDYSYMNLASADYESNKLYMLSSRGNIVYTTDEKLYGSNRQDEHIERFEKINKDKRTYVCKYKSINDIVFSIKTKKSDLGLVLVMERWWVSSLSAWKIVLLSIASLLISMLISTLSVPKLYKPFADVIELENSISKANINSNNEINNVISYVMNIVTQKQDVELKLARNALLLQDAQISMLQAQMNPHFLFNTLQLLNGIILAEMKEDTQAMEVVSLISRLLREAIDISKFVRPFSEDAESLEIYLEIQRIRYRGKFDVIWDVDERVEGLKVPKPVLQPLVENAIAHGIVKIRTNEKGVIKITAFLQDGIFYISVKDNGPGFTLERIREIEEILSGEVGVTDKKIGLYNVNRRIKILFGEAYGLTLLPGPGGEVVVSLPAEPYRNTDVRGIDEQEQRGTDNE